MMTRLAVISGLSALCFATPVLAEGSFTLDNNTGNTVSAVFAGPSDEDYWGPNILSERIGHRETMETFAVLKWRLASTMNTPVRRFCRGTVMAL